MLDVGLVLSCRYFNGKQIKLMTHYRIPVLLPRLIAVAL
jgi:hypothetical protein